MQGAIMSASSHPEESESGLNSEEEFLLLPSLTLPPQFVPGHLQDLEEALLCADLPTAYQTEDSKGNSSNDRDGANSVYSRHDASDDGRQDVRASEDSSSGYGQLQEQEMSSACCPFHSMHADLEVSPRKAAERSGTMSQVKAKADEVHKECEARCQWNDPEALCSRSIFEEDVPMWAAGHLEISGGEGSSDKGLLLEPVFVPGKLEDLEDALFCPNLQVDSEVRDKRDSDLAGWLLPEQHRSCSSLAALCHCVVSWGSPAATFQSLEEAPGSPCALKRKKRPVTSAGDREVPLDICMESFPSDSLPLSLHLLVFPSWEQDARGRQQTGEPRIRATLQRVPSSGTLEGHEKFKERSRTSVFQTQM